MNFLTDFGVSTGELAWPRLMVVVILGVIIAVEAVSPMGQQHAT